jgi:acetoin utilization deacetylase AcuC-like enzyme
MPPGGPVQPYLHAENPETKRRIRNLLEVSGLLDKLKPIPAVEATEEQLLRVHTREYLDRLAAMSAETGGDAGVFTPFGKDSYRIARLSAGGVIAAVDAVLDAAVDNAYALVRPPGHHALADCGMGFCLLCNGAIAGMHALEARGLKRIAFVDWDVHHGNGTQAAFWENPRALTISLHQDNCFPPESGPLEDNGAGPGKGFNINIPLPPGSGVGAYEAAFERVVVPALRAYRPELIIVPSGFDAGAFDPLGRMQMHSGGYRNLTRSLMRAADELCGGRIVMCHEGGYDAPTVPFYALAVIETLAGESSGVDDPFLEIMAGQGGQSLQPHQDEAIRRAEALLANL